MCGGETHAEREQHGGEAGARGTSPDKIPREDARAVRTPDRRPPTRVLRIVSAVSWPGVTITTTAVAKNAITPATLPGASPHPQPSQRRCANAVRYHHCGRSGAARRQ